MFWFDKQNPDVLFADSRVMERQEIWRRGDESRSFEVKPDLKMDFRSMALPDESFSLVVFDPPHLTTRNGKTGWMQKRYGRLGKGWKDGLRAGFSECFRVLRPNGVLVFKWSEANVRLSEVLKLTDQRPLFGHPSGKAMGTHWVCFMKAAA